MPAPQLVWFRNDLRVADHRALAAAAAAGPVHAVFLKAEAQWKAHGVGANRLAFLARNLRALAEALGALGIPFTVLEAPRFRDAPGVLLPWAQAQGAAALHFNDEYPLNERRRDDAVARAFAQAGVAVHRYTDSVLAAPGTLKTGQGGPYTVFTPFKRRWLAMLDLPTVAPRPSPRGRFVP
ncbi:MAG: deoxyribodipyrimidine photo-lyase [Pseudomonadales bacterium]